MTKRTRTSRQQPPARRRPQPRPGTTPGGAMPGSPSGGVGGADAPTPSREDATPNGGAAVQESAAPRAAATPAGARRVGRLDPASAAGRRTTKAQQKQQSAFAPLDPEDPAIPFDRVPYVPADLRRVAIMAGFMVLLIIIAAVVVTHTVG